MQYAAVGREDSAVGGDGDGDGGEEWRAGQAYRISGYEAACQERATQRGELSIKMQRTGDRRGLPSEGGIHQELRRVAKGGQKWRKTTLVGDGIQWRHGPWDFGGWDGDGWP